MAENQSIYLIQDYLIQPKEYYYREYSNEFWPLLNVFSYIKSNIKLTILAFGVHPRHEMKCLAALKSSHIYGTKYMKENSLSMFEGLW